MKKYISFLTIVLLFIFSVHLTPAKGEDVATPETGAAETTSLDSGTVENPPEEPVTTAMPEQENIPSLETDQNESTTTPESAKVELLDSASSSSASVDSGTIPTRFSADTSTSGGSSGPTVAAVWSMQGPAGQLSGEDDSNDPGAQFLPSGRFKISKRVSVCAVISGTEGINDISSVLGSVFYPQTSFGEARQDGRNGCGLSKEQNMQMSLLAKDDAVALLCGAIRNHNPNLPFFAGESGYGEICGADGELAKESAGVYCADMELAYDDLAGDYKVLVSAKDKNGADSETANAQFSYLELTAFETDFSGLDYGKARQGAMNSVDGDLVWQDPQGENNPTIRNVGNTRMKIEISQNDMGLGKTDGTWNIKYGTRFGANEKWQNYFPEEKILLEPVFSLSEAKPMDFAIKISHFPEDGTQNYLGKMTLNALKAEPLACLPSE